DLSSGPTNNPGSVTTRRRVTGVTHRTYECDRRSAPTLDAGPATVGTGDTGGGQVARGAAGDPTVVRPGQLGLQTLPATLEVAKLALQVRLETRAILALELLELLDVLLQRGALCVEAAHGLLVSLPSVALEGVRLGPRLASGLLGLGPRVGQQRL